ncbi:MAG: hypothetical protein JNM58_07755 [Xanthomonadaceae bacterium]|nr:hypothetical protein [Xanthomonadaceae bacterium]
MQRAEIRELLALLACGAAEDAELDAMATAVENAESDPELEFMRTLDADAAWYREVALQSALGGYTVVSDKIDELHEQVSDQFEEPLPEFPEAFWAEPVDHYFAWLDTELAARGEAHGGYRLVMLESGLDDNMVACVVRKPDVARILELAVSGSVRIEPASAAP